MLAIRHSTPLAIAVAGLLLVSGGRGLAQRLWLGDSFRETASHTPPSDGGFLTRTSQSYAFLRWAIHLCAGEVHQRAGRLLLSRASGVGAWLRPQFRRRPCRAQSDANPEGSQLPESSYQRKRRVRARRP